jgi:low temperature requirement protein LtrA
MELFFDLVFIFALTQLTLRQTQDPTVPGAIRSLLLIAAIWWVWTVTAWSTDWFDPEQPLIRCLLIWVMLGSLLLAASVTGAFTEWAVIFAGTYVVTHLGRGAFLIYLLRGNPAARRSARVAAWFAVTGAAWITGSLVQAIQYPLWAAAIVIDATIGLIGYPFPKLGRSSQEQLRVSGAHFTDRHRQLAIVAFGELILMSGLGFHSAGFHLRSTVAFVLAFGNALLFVQIYHLPLGDGLAATLDRSRAPGRLALTIGYIHYVLLVGVVTAATGNQLVIEHPTGTGENRYAGGIAAGSALLLAWRTASLLVVHRRPPWGLLLGLLALVAVAPATVSLPPVAESAAVDAVLLATVLIGQIMTRRRPAHVDPSPG